MTSDLGHHYHFYPRFPGDTTGGVVVRDEVVPVCLYAGRVDEKGRSLEKWVEVRVTKLVLYAGRVDENGRSLKWLREGVKQVAEKR